MLARRLMISSFIRRFTTSSENLRRVTLIPGDGVGPELMDSVRSVFAAAAVPVEFDEVNISEVQRNSQPIEDALASLSKHHVGLKGTLTTRATNTDLQSMNMALRKKLDLFAGVVHCKSFPGISSKHDDVDLIVIREMTEGEYSSLEHECVPGVVESYKIVTEVNSMRIAKFAFDYAVRHGRKKVTAVHKANIMKLGDGMFLRCCEEISKLYPSITFNSIIIDNCCMQLVSNPHQFDVLVTTNLYGNLIDNLVAGLVGGAGVVAGVGYSSNFALFEQVTEDLDSPLGARHTFGSAQGRDIANPTAMLLSSAYMLNHLNLTEHSLLIKNAVKRVIQDGKVRTQDIGGYSTTSEFTAAVISELR